MGAFVLQLFTNAVFAIEIPQSQVPSIILNKFQQSFPKAYDIEWELKNNIYEVEFEQGWGKDFEAWYTADGNLIRLKEELNKSDLPKAVASTLKTKYANYRIDDAKKITENKKTIYKVELENNMEEFTLFFNRNGQLLKQPTTY